MVGAVPVDTALGCAAQDFETGLARPEAVSTIKDGVVETGDTNAEKQNKDSDGESDTDGRGREGSGEKGLLRQASTFDGVFSNLSARPEVMVLPKATAEEPPPYEGPLGHETAFLQFEVSGTEEFDELLVDGLEVGSYPVYVLYLVVSMFFEWFGFFLSYTLSQSHAARYGSLSGLGITIALQSTRLEDLLMETAFGRRHATALPAAAFCAAFSGYVLFLYGLFAYHRMRTDAKARLARDRHSAA